MASLPGPFSMGINLQLSQPIDFAKGILRKCKYDHIFTYMNFSTFLLFPEMNTNTWYFCTVFETLIYMCKMYIPLQFTVAALCEAQVL